MCLSLLTTQLDLFKIEFLGEYLFPHVDESGSVWVNEVYDLFIRSFVDLDELSLLCLSPHGLVSRSGELQVSVDDIPGDGGSVDVVYDAPIGCGCDLDTAKHRFSTTMRDTGPEYLPTYVALSGELRKPEVSLPIELDDAECRMLMQETGTAFLTTIRELKQGKEYMARLAVRPTKLHGLPARVPIEPEWTKYPTAWKQQFGVVGPRLNYEERRQLIEATRNHKHPGTAATRLAMLIEDARRYVLNADIHRIVVVLPKNLEYTNHDCTGCVLPGISPPLPDDRQSFEWVAGARRYWRDDPRQVTERIWQYLHDWAGAAAKPVEYITVALKIDQQNTGVILDALARLGAVRNVDPALGLYAAVDLPKERLRQVFDQVQIDGRVRSKFRWNGYRITYWVRYFAAPRRVRFWMRHGPIITMLIAIASLALGLVSFFWAMCR
jgi:hypothetical protein